MRFGTGLETETRWLVRNSWSELLKRKSRTIPFSGSHQWNGYWGCIRFWARSILEGPDNWRAPKAVVVYMQDRNFNSFASNMIKLSVNEKMKYFACQDPRSSYSFYFDLNIWFRARRDFGQTGPWSVDIGRKTEITGKVNLMLLPKHCPLNVNLKTLGPNPLVNTFDSSFPTCCICGISS